jgi:UDP-galactopyranose mutase
MQYSGLKYLVVGSGLWGATFAQQIASKLNEKVLVIDKRSHWGGNSYSEIDAQTGIEYHKYGTHIFHTSSDNVWNYLNEFTSFNNYKHKVLITFKDKVYFMPINLSTINSYYGLNLKPSEAATFIQEEIEKANITNPQNLEEKAISLIGKPLYEAFIKGYTQKQWETSPVNLPAEIITRLPVRTDYNVNYFSNKYEGIPSCGYGEMIKKMLTHPNIELKLNTDYYDIKTQLPADCKIIFTGMLDELLDYKFGALDWRSLDFEWKTHNVADFQGTSVMNYGDVEIPYTRIHEFKHLHLERQGIFNKNQTIISIEHPKTFKKGDLAYYPINDEKNSKLYNLYKEEISKNPNIIAGGRLGAYKYWDMDKAIKNALETFDSLYKKGAF